MVDARSSVVVSHEAALMSRLQENTRVLARAGFAAGGAAVCLRHLPVRATQRWSRSATGIINIKRSRDPRIA